MENMTRFLTATEVAVILGISSASAYKIIKKMNEELKKKGKIILPGKVSRRYFEEKIYL